jgi:hypothetical protein
MLGWWSEQTKQDPNLLPMEKGDLEKAVFAVVIFNGEAPIAAAALVYAHTVSGQRIIYGGKTVLELGAAFVSPEQRGRGLWRQMAEERLKFLATSPQFLVTCVTRTLTVQKGLLHLGMVPLDIPEIKASLCCCKPDERAVCNVCPHKEGVQTLWCPG